LRTFYLHFYTPLAIRPYKTVKAKDQEEAIGLARGEMSILSTYLRSKNIGLVESGILVVPSSGGAGFKMAFSAGGATSAGEYGILSDRVPAPY
jgi:hypothetical protein